MDWKLFATAFTTVFLAELGDKTQLATATFAAAGGSRWVIFAASASALSLSALLATLVGSSLGKVVSPQLLMRLAGVGFIAVGVWVLASSRS
jgi:Ca2+/H+ antiporter, TMEM165/GDT1 family